ncbi:hypothetical protein [Escherichia coli]|uniref:hypothetical protein n=1 Tax=Escherichia coli TaxID=562 RepID=UPI003EBF84AA
MIDAVNGSQLKTTNDAVAANTTNIATNTTNITNLTDAVDRRSAIRAVCLARRGCRG